MSAPSLRDIEQTMRTLWTDRKSRERFLDGAPKGKRKPGLAIDSAPAELLEQIDKKGVNLYSGLLRYGHQDVMESIYPGCARLIGEKWHETVDNYLEQFPPEHYNLNRMAERFSEYLTKYGERWLKKYPFIAELAEYEWLELEILEAESPINKLPYEALGTPDQFESLAPAVNPVLIIKKYKYPIPAVVDHLQSQCCLSDIEPATTFVAIYRDPEQNSCRFLEIGEVTVQIVEAARQNSVSYKDLLTQAVSLAGLPIRNNLFWNSWSL